MIIITGNLLIDTLITFAVSFILAFVCAGVIVWTWHWIRRPRYYDWVCPRCGYGVMSTDRQHLEMLTYVHKDWHATNQLYGSDE